MDSLKNFTLQLMVPKLIQYGEEAKDAIFIDKRPAIVLYEDKKDSKAFKAFEEACDNLSVLCVHTDGQDKEINRIFGSGDLTPLRAI